MNASQIIALMIPLLLIVLVYVLFKKNPKRKIVSKTPKQINEKEVIYEPNSISNQKIDSAFIEKCINQQYFEIDESRSWDSDPDFNEILTPLNNGNYSLAIETCLKYSVKYNDFGLLFTWWSKALMKKGDIISSKNVLIEGLSKSKSKFDLLNSMGELEFQKSNIKDAIFWWSQGLHCQRSVPRNGDCEDSFLFLYYVSLGLDLPDCAKSFIQVVDLINPGEIRLSPEYGNSIIRLTKLTKNDDLIKIVRTLVDKHLSGKKVTTKVISVEFNDLIKVASDSNLTDQQRYEAIRKLGEIGDKRAIEPLMRIYKNEITIASLDAKEAIDKILGR